MAAIAASVAAILIVGLGLSPLYAVAGGAGGVALIALVNRLATRVAVTRPATLRFFELEERIGLLHERVLALEPRLARVDQAAQETARRAHAPLENEIAELGSLVRALAEQVERHENALTELPARHAAWAVSQHAPLPELPPELYEPPPPAPPPPAPVAPPSPPVARVAALDPQKARTIRRAIESEGIELHLQPVAALPQRRVVQYNAVPYLRDHDGVLLPPAEFAADARLAGLQPALDAFVLDRALRVARRLKARDREISLLINLEGETLGAPNFTTDIAKRLDANTDLATHLVIGFSQDALYGFGTVEAEMLASVGERSFRFALTGVRDLDLDAQALHTLGVRFLRVPAGLLTDPDKVQESSIHPADLPGLLRRHGILLIAEDADTEAQVADLLDIDVRAAQGGVFGVPRPVRPEIFAGEQTPPQPRPAIAPASAAPTPMRPFRSVTRRA